MSNPSHSRNLDPFFTESEPEIRSVDGGGITVRGYWAKFNVRSREMTTKKGVRFTESIAPGAFDNTDFSDVECCYNHDERQFLASDPTLRYGVDSTGAWYEYDHDPNDPVHVSALRRIQRRNTKGASFQFPPLPSDCYEVRDEAGIKHRTITRFPRVVEFGPVRVPAYPDTTTFARSLDGAYETELNPTDAQKEAGNFKKGRVVIARMAIAVENPLGSTRSGTSKDGTKWSREMKAHYGYISGSNAADGDNIDVFFTDDAESAKAVFVVDQILPDGSFDEHKVLIGPKNQDEARSLYLAHYPDGWTGLGALSCVPMECFRAWAMDGTTKKTPLAYEPNFAPMLDPTKAAALRQIFDSAKTDIAQILAQTNPQTRLRKFKALHP